MAGYLPASCSTPVTVSQFHSFTVSQFHSFMVPLYTCGWIETMWESSVLPNNTGLVCVSSPFSLELKHSGPSC